MAERAIFLDRDGVINVRRSDHVKSWREFEFMPGSLQALRELALMGERVVVVTNQAAVGRGLLSAADLADIHARMGASVAASGGRIDAVYVCPHLPQAGCTCRKPHVQLLFQAAAELGIDLSGSMLVGDSTSDMKAALAAGCAPIFIGEAADHGLDRELPAARDLPGAVTMIRHVLAAVGLLC